MQALKKVTYPQLKGVNRYYVPLKFGNTKIYKLCIKVTVERVSIGFVSLENCHNFLLSFFTVKGPGFTFKPKYNSFVPTFVWGHKTLKTGFLVFWIELKPILLVPILLKYSFRDIALETIKQRMFERFSKEQITLKLS